MHLSAKIVNKINEKHTKIKIIPNTRYKTLLSLTLKIQIDKREAITQVGYYEVRMA